MYTKETDTIIYADAITYAPVHAHSPRTYFPPVTDPTSEDCLLALISCCAFIQLPKPTAIAPTACAAPDASIVPPAPAATAGSAGIVPAVIRMALSVLITLGCSLTKKSSALQASMSHMGALAVVVVTAAVHVSCRHSKGGRLKKTYYCQTGRVQSQFQVWRFALPSRRQP